MTDQRLDELGERFVGRRMRWLFGIAFGTYIAAPEAWDARFMRGYHGRPMSLPHAPVMARKGVTHG